MATVTSSIPLRPLPAVLVGGRMSVMALARGGIPVRLVTSEPGAWLRKPRGADGVLVVAPLDGPTEPHALASLLRAGRDLEERVGLRAPLLADSVETVSFLARHRERLCERFIVLAPSPSVVSAALARETLVRFASGRALPVSDAGPATRSNGDHATLWVTGIADPHGRLLDLETERGGTSARGGVLCGGGEPSTPRGAEDFVAEVSSRLGLAGPFAMAIERDATRLALVALDLGVASLFRCGPAVGATLALRTYRHLERRARGLVPPHGTGGEPAAAGRAASV